MNSILRPLTPRSRPNSLTSVRLPFELTTTAHGIDAARVVMMMHCGGSAPSSAYVRLLPTPSRAYAMGMPAQQTEWTAEEALALPYDGNRYEVLDGELFVSPAPSFSHQFVVQGFVTRLMPYVDQHQLGWVLAAPADLTFSTRRLVQPDIFVVSDTGQGRPREWKDVRRLSLVVEVLSPSTARADRWRKRTIYQSERIPEYWIVDPDAR